ncbi:hypothetical protein C8R43DRAFT_1135352 [Mycena crocata]|nr:hypothetical protein C8R43DRAFT_1135352 [Mycena crocata]
MTLLRGNCDASRLKTFLMGIVWHAPLQQVNGGVAPPSGRRARYRVAVRAHPPKLGSFFLQPWRLVFVSVNTLYTIKCPHPLTGASEASLYSSEHVKRANHLNTGTPVFLVLPAVLALSPFAPPAHSLTQRCFGPVSPFPSTTDSYPVLHHTNLLPGGPQVSTVPAAPKRLRTRYNHLRASALQQPPPSLSAPSTQAHWRHSGTSHLLSNTLLASPPLPPLRRPTDLDTPQHHDEGTPAHVLPESLARLPLSALAMYPPSRRLHPCRSRPCAGPQTWILPNITMREP